MEHIDSNTHKEYVLSFIRKEEQAAIAKQLKLKGIEFEGVMCSATEADQNGLSAILLKYTIALLNNTRIDNYTFLFANGNTLTITHDNLPLLDQIWTPFRQSFFQLS